jgi:(2R)-3-sulfolactate dehydrogenase (NADP+)
MAPAAGYKGVGSALLVEIFAACLAGATPGIEASPFSGTAGGPPRTGQFFLALAPEPSSGGVFAARLETVVTAFADEEVVARLPGARRRAFRAEAERCGIDVDETAHAGLLKLAGAAA